LFLPVQTTSAGDAFRQEQQATAAQGHTPGGAALAGASPGVRGGAARHAARDARCKGQVGRCEWAAANEGEQAGGRSSAAQGHQQAEQHLAGQAMAGPWPAAGGTSCPQHVAAQV